MPGYREFAPRPQLDEVVACTWTRLAPEATAAPRTAGCAPM